MTRYLLVTRATFGLVYQIVGGVENGRTLTLEQYDALVSSGIPVVRQAS